MAQRVAVAGLSVDKTLHDVIVGAMLPATGLAPDVFFQGLARLAAAFGPENRRLLARRDAMQAAINVWHAQRTGQPHDADAYRCFLAGIGYLLPEGPDFTIETKGVDPEIARVAGPQLVVPVTNARYAINAANARWGSLYDALYGSDAIPATEGAAPGPLYNPARGAKVMAYAAGFLDTVAPLAVGSHAGVREYGLDKSGGRVRAAMTLTDGTVTGLVDPDGFVGFTEGASGRDLVVRHHGLHVIIRVNRVHPIGASHVAGLADIIVEAAVTTILDLEDSVAVVDGPDKAAAYRNLLGLLRGDLTATFTKAGRQITRTLAADRTFTAPDGAELTLPGRSLLLVRNVGHLMTTDAVLTADGREVPEGLLDTLVTGLIGLHDLRRLGPLPNSRTGSIYIVKPKMHGPEEVAFACRMFDAVEDVLTLPRHTLKIGIMDEERRTSLNLKECVRAAKERIIFINTGFLDRTGDEIHTVMAAGPVVATEAMRAEPWIRAYEDRNVDVGLACGFSGRAQIGKGMWAKPDRLAEMLDVKIAHPQAGANCAWVPSPTAATLHALHYHAVDVFARQRELAAAPPRADRETLLVLPLLGRKRPSLKGVTRELEAQAQSLLGYVARWVGLGIGCSKVPDIHDVGLMEDRATLRIASQFVANWLRHGLCDRELVLTCLRRMAAVVDRQNAQDPTYRPMAPDFAASPAFAAACDLIFQGEAQPNGYTEPVLTVWRRRVKASGGAV